MEVTAHETELVVMTDQPNSGAPGASQHVPAGVCVTVGATTGGFFVEDLIGEMRAMVADWGYRVPDDRAVTIATVGGEDGRWIAVVPVGLDARQRSEIRRLVVRTLRVAGQSNEVSMFAADWLSEELGDADREVLEDWKTILIHAGFQRSSIEACRMIGLAFYAALVSGCIHREQYDTAKALLGRRWGYVSPE
jgi:hypothetical protein